MFERNITINGFIFVCILVILNKNKAGALPRPHEHKLSVSEKQLNTIQSYMDLTVVPCVDFYGYSCGSWRKHHDGSRYMEAGGFTDHKVNKKLVNLLEKYEPVGDLNNVYDKVWTYYKSCRRTKKYQQENYLRILKSEKVIDWPLSRLMQNDTSELSEEHFDWVVTLAKLRIYGFDNVFIQQSVLPSALDATHATFYFDIAPLETMLEKNLTVGILKRLGAEFADQTANDVIDLEERVHELLETAENDDDMGLVTLEELEENLSEMPWRKYLQIVLETNNVPSDYKVQISNAETVQNLAKLLAKFDPATISHYILIRFLYYMAADSTMLFDKIECLVDVRNKMELAVNFIYKEQFYDAKADLYNAEVERIFELLRGEFLAKLNQNRLNLSAAQIELQELKLQKIILLIGNLPKNVDVNFIANYYSRAELKLNNYYWNHLSLLALRNRQDFARIINGIPSGDDFFVINHDTFSYSSVPYFYARGNAVIVPYGILQPPIFHKNMHDVLKLSLFGFVLGHELIHAFDNTGVQIDYKGNIDEASSNITDNIYFSAALECMQEDETTSIDERIADISGIRVAYDALFGANSTLNVGQPEFTTIPMHRLFFLNVAQFFCGNLQAEDATHDADDVRLRQMLFNFEPFAKAFQCELGVPMHRVRKCRLW